jgi:DNA-binding NarL/FixJ family response regulator
MTLDRATREPAAENYFAPMRDSDLFTKIAAAHRKMRQHEEKAAAAQIKRDAAILAAVEEGASHGEIARALGVSASGVRLAAIRAKAHRP